MNNQRGWCGNGMETFALDNLLKSDPGLFRMVSGQLAAHLSKMRVPPSEIDDLSAEAWLKAVKYRDRFAGDAPERRLLCWMIKVVHHKALDRMRRLAKQLCEALDAGKEEPIDEGEAQRAETAEMSEQVSALLEKIGRGNEKSVRLFRGHYFQEFSIQELAQQFGMTAKSVDCRIRRLVKKLNKLAEGSPRSKSKASFDFAPPGKKK
jgi:RNA polymerase sigma factor (sigma-70 family)